MDVASNSQGLKIAYITSRFPKLSETFILYEMIAMESLGAEIDVYALIQEKEKTIHPEAARFLPNANYGKLTSSAVIAAQFRWLFKNPILYFSTFFQAIRGNISSTGFLARAFMVFPAAAWFALEMSRSGTDHIHAHWATHSALAAWVASKLTGIPYSFTAHANDLFVNQTMLKQKINDAKFVATISEYNRQFMLDGGHVNDASKIKIVHCGTDTSFFSDPEIGVIRQQDGEGTKPFTLCCIGRLVTKKGQNYLIDACHQLKSHNIPFVCKIAGDGVTLEELKDQVAKLGLQNEVQFLGKITREEVMDTLKSSDVKVLPSVTDKSGGMEGIPVVLMEAMAMGLPVISTRISGIPELVIDGENGLLVPERDVEALADALIKIANHQSWALELGQRGREKVLTEFDLYKNADLLYSLIQDREPEHRETQLQLQSAAI